MLDKNQKTKSLGIRLSPFDMSVLEVASKYENLTIAELTRNSIKFYLHKYFLGEGLKELKEIKEINMELGMTKIQETLKQEKLYHEEIIHMLDESKSQLKDLEDLNKGLRKILKNYINEKT